MRFLNGIFPAKCVICENLFVFEDQNLFCNLCLSTVKKEKIYYCNSCGDKVENCQKCLKKRVFDRIEIFKSNDRYITEILYYMKIKGFKNLSRTISQKIEEDITGFVKKKKIDLITYIPLDRKTYRKRTFNHLEEILREIFPSYIIDSVVEKTRETRLQMELNREERLKNLKGAFNLKKDIKGKKILIFDDIMTTGSTMFEMYKTIKKGNPERIYGYVIAR
ncbi:comF family protein [Persephonella hydrogeniphila]|uniref:ComF family protein n=1 Tax=Persephonella hydrogeniphila TaxID=198703 RepID=A0A285NCT9_9AQUI|nr:phosphoribosyltransferase family protein [Persephonella hydrogeniphila]SNZ06747.1 comF family protein [Persephonella hydrogeniphila]